MSSSYELSEEKEIEAIAFIIDEIDLILHVKNKHRKKFDFIKKEFERKKNLSQDQKRVLLRIYEVVSDLGFGVNEH